MLQFEDIKEKEGIKENLKIGVPFSYHLKSVL